MWRTRRFEHSVVVLGAGFAGVACARRVQRRLRGRPSTHVCLVDQENYFVYQPLLPEVVSASIDVSHVINPVRQLAPDVDFDCAEVARIDLDARLVHFKHPEGIPITPMPYTHLVLAMGKVPNLGVVPGMAAHGYPIKTVGDAFALRSELIMRLELAANLRDPELRRELLTVVCVGGGFSGVETCAEIHDMLHIARRWYPELAGEPIRTLLVASTDRILPALSETLSAYALRKLTARGVEVRLDARVVSVTPRTAVLGDGTVVATRCVVTAIGDSTHPVIASLGLPMHRGCVVVDPDLRVRGHADVWAVGDCAWVINGHDGKPSPPTAQFSEPQGLRCADNVVACIDGTPPTPFAHRAKGYMASLGHRTAVAEAFGIRLSGFGAWFAWRTFYLFKLPGLARKVRVALDWTLDLFFSRDIVMLHGQRTVRSGRQHYEVGQDIVVQGDAADTFFTIDRGEVDVLVDGVTVARLGPGTPFGERALLENSVRTATVRAATPVDVVTLGRSDFEALTATLPVLRDALARAHPRDRTTAAATQEAS